MSELNPPSEANRFSGDGEPMRAGQTQQVELDLPRSRLGNLLRTSKAAQACEIAVLFLVAFAIIGAVRLLSGENPMAQQVAASLAILLIIALVWFGLKLRGQTWQHFGLSLRLGNRRSIVRTLLQSLVVLIGAVAAFIAAAIVFENLARQPDQPDMSGYDSLQGNLPLLAVMLLGIYITASFGEEVIYRAFLMNRIAELGSGSKGAWALAVVLSSVAFGLAHFAWGLAGMVQTGFMGLALGVSYLAVGRNLWVTILAHGYMDTMLMLQMYFGASKVVTD